MYNQKINKDLFLPKSVFFKSNIIKRPTILIFDSGVGGLSIYNKVRQLLPNAHYLYVFDNDAFPYGDKPEHFIIDRVINIVGTIQQYHKVNLVIIACNTASIVSLPELRRHFFCPIIGVVPAIKPAAELTSNGIIGLLATHTTVQHGYTFALIKQFASLCQILTIGSTELVFLAEAKLHGHNVPINMLRKILHPWLNNKKQPDTIVLGCTHFTFINRELQKILPESTILIDASLAIAQRAMWLVQHDVNVNDLQEEKRDNKAYYLSTTSQAIALTPVMIRHGFGSLEKLFR